MKKLFLFAPMFCMLLSCTKEEISFEERIPINISVGQQTRANDSNFEAGDKVGIYVVNYTESGAGTLGLSGNHVDNMGFTYGDGKWTPTETIYWKDKNTNADFYAYYPYSGAVSTVTAHPFSVQANQSTETNFWASDFLWGKAEDVTPSSTAVPIVTNHVLSRIIVEVKPGSGFTAESWLAATKSVKISGMKTSATVNLATGVATATGAAADVIPLHSSTDGSTLTYKAMVVPQTVAENTKLVVITVNGTEYVYRKGYTFNANTQHKFTITVAKNELGVDVTIGVWSNDSNDNVGAAEEESIVSDKQV